MLTMVTVEMEVVIMMIGRANLSKKLNTNSIFIALSHAWAFCGFTVGCMDAIVEMIIIIILQ